MTVGTLVLLDGAEQYSILLGHMDPIGCESGLYARLQNLGYLPNASPTDAEAKDAILSFQADHDLDETGVADGPTLEWLTELHES